MTRDELREAFANQAHISRSGWWDYAFKEGLYNEDGSLTLPPGLVERWTRQMNTDYENLSWSERQSDLKEADKYLELLEFPQNTDFS